MASGQKKVIVRQHSGELAWGYLPAGGFVHSGQVQMLALDGRVTSFALSEIAWIAYVRDFNREDPEEPERLGRRSFQGRPRTGGLWLKLTLVNDETLEGTSTFDLAALNALSDDQGLHLAPPDGRSNTQRLYIPRQALKSIEVLGWISTAPKASRVPAKPSAGDDQPNLFSE
jgi:hypothetical protein